MSVLLGSGDGTFQAAVNSSAGSFPQSVALGDFNGDGKADLAVAGSSRVSVLLGNGDGTFQTRVNYNAGSFPQSVAVGDFNGDGKADLVVANYGSNNVSILLGVAGGAASLSRAAINFGNQANGVASAAKTVIVTNTGNAMLTITAVAAAGDFFASGCVTSLSAGATCTLSITFTPTATGMHRGSVAVIDNATGSPQVIRLFGKGT